MGRQKRCSYVERYVLHGVPVPTLPSFSIPMIMRLLSSKQGPSTKFFSVRRGAGSISRLSGRKVRLAVALFGPPTAITRMVPAWELHFAVFAQESQTTVLATKTSLGCGAVRCSQMEPLLVAGTTREQIKAQLTAAHVGGTQRCLYRLHQLSQPPQVSVSALAKVVAASLRRTV